jgi:hypothetical protein
MTARTALNDHANRQSISDTTGASADEKLTITSATNGALSRYPTCRGTPGCLRGACTGCTNSSKHPRVGDQCLPAGDLGAQPAAIMGRALGDERPWTRAYDRGSERHLKVDNPMFRSGQGRILGDRASWGRLPGRCFRGSRTSGQQCGGRAYRRWSQPWGWAPAAWSVS